MTPVCGGKLNGLVLRVIIEIPEQCRQSRAIVRGENMNNVWFDALLKSVQKMDEITRGERLLSREPVVAAAQVNAIPERPHLPSKYLPH